MGVAVLGIKVGNRNGLVGVRVGCSNKRRRLTISVEKYLFKGTRVTARVSDPTLKRDCKLPNFSTVLA